MDRYAYSYRREIVEDEVYFHFPKFPELFSTLTLESYRTLSGREIQAHVSDAVLTALQTRMTAKDEIPAGDEENVPDAVGLVVLTVQQAMKLEMYKLYVARCASVSDFARHIDRKITAARRLLDLRHPSVVTEIENVFEIFGKRLVHCWAIEADVSPGHMVRTSPVARRKARAPAA